jgi:1-acyl-sn-glycerol-3-phosphate acyltransferase
MRKLLGFILTPFVALTFFLILCIFHPIQWLALKLFGYEGHKKTVDALNFCLVGSIYLGGNTVSLINKQTLPAGRPMIFIANHQSSFDISPLSWFLRKYHPKFISKIELTRGLPSISFNLKYGGAANIDRKDPRQSISEIVKLGVNMKEKNWSAVIFPEGTRSKDGKVKTFQSAGIAALLKKCPNALLVPVAIKNSWKLVRYGYYPLNTFTHVTFEVLEPIEPAKRPADELVKLAEDRIREKLGVRG